MLGPAFCASGIDQKYFAAEFDVNTFLAHVRGDFGEEDFEACDPFRRDGDFVLAMLAVMIVSVIIFPMAGMLPEETV